MIIIMLILNMSETGIWLFTEEHIIRDIVCCAIYAGDIAMLPVGSSASILEERCYDNEYDNETNNN